MLDACLFKFWSKLLSSCFICVTLVKSNSLSLNFVMQKNVAVCITIQLSKKGRYTQETRYLQNVGKSSRVKVRVLHGGTLEKRLAYAIQKKSRN